MPAASTTLGRRCCGRRTAPWPEHGAAIRAKSGLQKAFHSVMMASASAPMPPRPWRRQPASRSVALTEHAAALRHQPPDRRPARVAPAAAQRLHQRAAGRFAHVVGIGFERQTPDGDRAALEIAAEMLLHLLRTVWISGRN